MFIFTGFMFDYDTFDSLKYYDHTNDLLIKDSLLPDDYTFSDGMCNISSQIDVGFRTDDMAMLATLPRMYRINVSDRGRGCYIIPNQIGVFNSTMKYIFGEDYMEQDIQIYCDPYHHIPFLVLTSQKIYEETLKRYNSSEINIVKENIATVKSSEYFDINHLCEDGIAEDSCHILKDCISKNYGNVY